MSAKLKVKANSLCKEALQSLTITLAGSDTKHFWDLLTAFFGANHTGDNDDLWDFSVLAVWDWPPSQTPVAQLASALVMADLPDPSTTPADDLSDMPELEKSPPGKFHFPPKKHRKEDH